MNDSWWLNENLVSYCKTSALQPYHPTRKSEYGTLQYIEHAIHFVLHGWVKEVCIYVWSYRNDPKPDKFSNGVQGSMFKYNHAPRIPVYTYTTVRSILESTCRIARFICILDLLAHIAIRSSLSNTHRHTAYRYTIPLPSVFLCIVCRRWMTWMFRAPTLVHTGVKDRWDSGLKALWSLVWSYQCQFEGAQAKCLERLHAIQMNPSFTLARSMGIYIARGRPRCHETIQIRQRGSIDYLLLRFSHSADSRIILMSHGGIYP